MIDFDQELKKFKPAVGVDVGANDIFDDDYKDIKVPDNVKLVPFMNDLINLLKDTDLIVSRAGASTIAEITAIRNTFNDCLNDIYLSSTKSMTGHLLGAAGAVEALFCVKALQEQILPPSINIDNVDNCFKGLNIIKKAVSCPVNMVLSNSFGFGGTNGCLIFKKYDK